jgi:large subunit ribosomal protein L9e
VTVKVKARVVEVKGPRGTIKRSFKHMTADMKVVKTADGKKKFVIEKWFASYKLKSAVTTISSHVYNMVVGVTRVN